jgi:spiro-SPASM protein
MNQNEDELEAFYRYWSNKENESGGNLTIQKYNNYCGLLADEKPADLSPLERNVCWHLRRDMTILSNGDVPVCSQQIFNSCAGNVFVDGIENVWGKTNELLKANCCGDYDEKCKKCDEYYTFNF